MRRQTFTSIRTEGGLFPPDFLQRITGAVSGVAGLTPEAYHLAGHEKLNEAASRAWNRLLGIWTVFYSTSIPTGDAGTTVTREKWLLPLFAELGYGRLQQARAADVNGKSYPVSHAWQHVPIHLVGRNIDLDHRTAGVAGAARTSPHSLSQELLNRREESQWGFVSNGLKLRLLRDNRSLTRQAYVEFDLVAMMEGQAFSDFVVLWLMCHQSRVEAVAPEPCWLEKWATEAREQGTRALNELRNGVKDAIESLGRGFLKHPANKPLLEKLRAGSLDRQDYYRQLLRVVYRLIFLFVAEARELLLVAEPGSAAAERYSQFYSIARLRDLAASRRGTPHGDLWQSLQVVVRGLSSERGLAELGLPALGSFLWSASATPDLDSCQIANTNLLDAIRALAFRMDGNIRRRVDWRNLGPEELGSVYESLLELHPVLNSTAATFDLNEAPGHERKETGSYYTPTSLVDCLLDSALDPVLDEAAKSAEPERAILHLKICDPACGSGHFLIAAAHRIARRLAAIRTGDAEASPEAVRRALRDVIGHCLYGVDINEMAVELCKVNLWLEALDPGKPLSFLDQRIRCGNSLLGATPALLRGGIPDEAFTPIEGDDPEQCRFLKRANRLERQGFQNLVNAEAWQRIGDLATGIAALEEIDDSTLEGVHRLETRYSELVRSSDYQCGRLWADAWCAAFVWPKTRDAQPLTEDMFRVIERNPMAAPNALREEIRRIAKQYRFFHWHLAFPAVFRVPSEGRIAENERAGWDGGFDVLLGNPPWERININQKEWFAARNRDISAARNVAVRTAQINDLQQDDPFLWAEWIEASRNAESVTSFARGSGLYPLCAHGDINSYALFAELNKFLVSPHGIVGCILPSGIATDKTTRFFFSSLMKRGGLRRFFEFENEGFFSAGHGHMLRFALIAINGGSRRTADTDFFFQGEAVSELADPNRHFTLSSEDIELINPNTLTCPIFRTRKDADITKSIYHRVPVFQRDSAPESSWNASLGRTLHMGDDAALFKTKEELYACGAELVSNVFLLGDERLLPLYEAKMIYQFDHRYGDCRDLSGTEREHRLPSVSVDRLRDPEYVPLPYYWVVEDEVESRLERRDWTHDWLLGWRDVTDARASIRTVISTAIPRVGTSDKFPLLLPTSHACGLLGVLSCFVLDYCARQKLGGISLKQFIFRQLPIPSAQTFDTSPPFVGAHVGRWMISRVLELSYTAWDLCAFALDHGFAGAPFRWNGERRFFLRCELDAACFHLYGVAREDAAYIMDTFPIVRRSDESQYGEYRTKRTILEMYERMQRAIDTGEPYQTMLDPPPANPSLCHPKKKVGVLAFGSLIQDPGEELRAKTTMKIKTQTPFPVEYGRYSGKTRGGAPTLVPHAKGASVAAEIFVMADDLTVEETTNMLWRRETGRVGTLETYKRGTGADSVLVEHVANNPWVETVLYTDFNSAGKIENPAATELAKQAIASVTRAEDGKDGITYLRKAVAWGIETPLTSGYRDEILRQMGTTSLEDALTKAKENESAREAGTHE